MRRGTQARRAPVLRLWFLVAAGLIAVMSAQSSDHNGDHNGPPGGHNGDHNGPPGEHNGDHNGPPGGGEGHNGDHNGPPGEHSGDGNGGDNGEHSGPPGEHNGDHNGPPGDGEGHGGPIGGETGTFRGGGGERAEACTTEQTQAAVDASTEFVKCTGLNYADFLALVHTDVELLEQAATCFKESVKEIEQEAKEKGETIEVDAGELFADCLEAVENADETHSAEATAAFLDRMLGPKSEVCSCLPAYVDNMPLCDPWAHYHRFGIRLETLCDSIDTASLPIGGRFDEATEATTTEAKKTEMNDVDPNAGVEVKNEDPRIPDAYGPCPPGQNVHPEDPKKCQPEQSSTETYYEGASGGRDEGGPPAQGGLLGLGMSVLGIVAVGGVIGVGGVWAWGKFQDGTRQPGVRYMATDAGADIGTELGPFGREYP